MPRVAEGTLWVAAGLLGGLAAIALGTPGFLVLAAVVVAGSLRRPRFTWLACVLCAVGSSWLAFAVMASTTCRNGDSCGGDDVLPFGLLAASILLAGVAAAGWTAIRARACH
jgi:hypothetical protein